MLTDSFFCHCTSTEGTYHRQFINCARFQFSAYRRNYYYLFKQNVLIAHIPKKNASQSTDVIFGKYLEPPKEHTRFA